MKKTSNLIVSRKGGGCIVSKKPVFALDGQLLLTVQNNIVHAYSTVTGELVRSYNGLVNTIVDIFICLNNEKYFTACSVTGELFVFNIETGIEVGRNKLKYNEISTVIHFSILPSKDELYNILVTFQNVQNMDSIICLYSMKSLTCIRVIKKITCQQEKIVLSVGGTVENNFIAIVQKNKLLIHSVVDKNEQNSYFLGSKRNFVTVCCHPTELVIATGDNTGRIVIWRNLFNGNLIQSVFHWHTLPVRCISFSHSGTYFYSGGEECVLVKWFISTPGDKTFLPRMPAPVVHISVNKDNSKVAVCSTDNAIQIIDGQQKLKCTIQHMSWGIITGTHKPLFPAGLNYDFRTWSFVLNSRTGHIQFYSPQTKTLLYNLDITGKNYLTQERNQTIYNTDVVKIALSRFGFWIATVEERNDGETNLETCLKFWNFDSVSQSWNQNTCVVLPHDGSIHCVIFKPSSSAQVENSKMMCVTTGTDKKIKIWNLVDSSDIYKKCMSWCCSSVAYYRDFPVTSACFSYDGSLLAACFHSNLTVWIPDSCELKCSLTYSPHVMQSLTHVLFGNTDQCHLIITTSENRLCVWNLLTLTLVWTVLLEVKHLCGDPKSSIVAAMTKTNSLYIFMPGFSTPIYINHSICKPNVEILSICFFPHRIQNEHYDWQKHSQLYFITSEEELLTLENSESDKVYDNLEELTHKRVNLSMFNTLNAMQSKSVVDVSQNKEYFRTGLPGSASIKDLINQSSHVTAPMRLLCNSILQSMVLSTTTESKNNTLDKTHRSLRLKFSDSDLPVDQSDEDSDIEMNLKKDLPSASSRVVQQKEKINADIDKTLNNILDSDVSWSTTLVSSWCKSTL